MTKFNKCTFQGPQTSKTIHGVHFRSGASVYLTDVELPMSASVLRKENITVEEVELDERPVPEAEVAKSGVGIMWVGKAPLKLTDYGNFKRNEPRHDISLEGVEHLLKKPNFRKVE